MMAFWHSVVQHKEVFMPSLSPQELVNNNIELVSLPAIVTRVNEMLNSPTASAADIAELISQDPGLTLRLLKIVNSPFYSFPSKIETVSMAVTVLGTSQLRDLLIATTLVKRFQSKDDTAFDIETFWCHSITTGLAARAIALDRKIPNSERLFISGLLHDIGKMLMALLLPMHYAELNKSYLQRVKANESDIFGFNHDELGECLLDSWHFPTTIAKPIRHHHDLQSTDIYKTDTAILHMANVIANNIQAPISPDDDTLLNPLALNTLNMDERDIEPYYESVYQLLDQILQTLYYDIAA
jgi:HD-like signal output (HDOD) protein